MFKDFAFLVAPLALLSGMSTSVAAQNLDNLASLATMSGKCHKLVIGGADASALCKAMVTNAAYKTGKSSFTFVAGESAIVGFFGADSRAEGNKAVLKVEQITLNLMMGTPSTMAPANGTCTYTNPYAGPSLVQCSAVSGGKTYSATFVSDGRSPEVKQF